MEEKLRLCKRPEECETGVQREEGREMDRKVVEEGDRGLGGEGRGKEEGAQVRGNSNQRLTDQRRERGVLRPSRTGK